MLAVWQMAVFPSLIGSKFWRVAVGDPCAPHNSDDQPPSSGRMKLRSRGAVSGSPTGFQLAATTGGGIGKVGRKVLVSPQPPVSVKGVTVGQVGALPPRPLSSDGIPPSAMGY